MKKKEELIKLATLVEEHDETVCRVQCCETCKEINELRSRLFIDGKYFLNDMQTGEIVKFDRRIDMSMFLGVKEYIVNNMLVFGRAAVGYTADYVIRL